MARQDTLFRSIVVARYRNSNPHPDDPRRGVCAYCRAILNWLRNRYVLVGSDLYYKLSPKQHPRCWCDWEYDLIPAYRIDEVLTDDDITYDELFRQFGEKAQKAAGEDKQPYWYREELRLRRRERQLVGLAFLAGAGVGLLAATFKDEDYRDAKKRIRELRRKDRADDEIVKVILKEYPDKSGLKALKDFGYL